MGYSVSAKADYVMTALLAELQMAGPAKASNGWTIGKREYFEEVGKENDDGAMTGTIHQIKNGLCYKAGSFRIEPDGKISRFPASNKQQRESAIIAGLIEYHKLHAVQLDK